MEEGSPGFDGGLKAVLVKLNETGVDNSCIISRDGVLIEAECASPEGCESFAAWPPLAGAEATHYLRAPGQGVPRLVDPGGRPQDRRSRQEKGALLPPGDRGTVLGVTERYPDRAAHVRKGEGRPDNRRKACQSSCLLVPADAGTARNRRLLIDPAAGAALIAPSASQQHIYVIFILLPYSK
jgi:hypothetical protein